MKRKISIFTTYLIIVFIFIFTSCVQDDIYFKGDDLTINSHTPITRSAMESEQSLIQSESDIIKK